MSKVDLTGERLGNGTKRLDNVLKWIDRVRAREGVSNGLRWGFEGKEDEIDKWSEERRNSYKKVVAILLSLMVLIKPLNCKYMIILCVFF